MYKVLKNSINHIVIVLFILFAARLFLPQYIKYLLFPGVLISSLLLLYSYRNISGKKLIKSSLWPFWLLIILYLLSFMVTSHKQIDLYKDLINGLFAIVFLFVILTNISSLSTFGNILTNVQTYIFYIGASFAFFGIVKLVLQLFGIYFNFLEVDGMGYPFGTSTAIDDNFFSLACVLSIVFAIPLLFKKLKICRSLLFQGAIFILLLNILLSTSRRGLLVASLFISFLIAAALIGSFSRSDKLKNLRNNSILVILLTFLAFSFYCFITFKIDPLDRNRWLVKSRLSHSEVNNYLNWLTLTGKTVLRGQVTYDNVKKDLWETSFDSKFPYTGWAAGNYKLVEKPYGENANIVPSGAQGALVDNREKGSKRDGNAYYYSKLFESNVKRAKRTISSVYCYVSPDFNGDWVRISAYGEIRGLKSSYYDMKKKGIWQKLLVSFEGDTGKYSIYFYLAKENANSFKDLMGYIIYAYPESDEVDFDAKLPSTWASKEFEEIINLPGDPSFLPTGSKGLCFKSNSYYIRDSLQYAQSDIDLDFKQDGITRNIVSIYSYVSNDFNGEEVKLETLGSFYGIGNSEYNLNRKGEWQKLTVAFSSVINNRVRISVKKIKKNADDILRGDVFFAYPTLDSSRFDPRKPSTWAERRFKEAPIQQGDNYHIIPDGSIGYRLDKWSEYLYSQTLQQYITYTRFGKYKLIKNKRYLSSIYCLVSKDFNGIDVKLGAWGNYKGDGSSFYDMSAKGKWQKLVINNYGDSGDYEPFIYFSLPKGVSSEKLVGNVVFAYPTVNIIDYSPYDPKSYCKDKYSEVSIQNAPVDLNLPVGTMGAKFDKTSCGRPFKNLFQYTCDFLSIPVEKNDSIECSIYCYVSEDYNGNDVRVELKGDVKGYHFSRYDLKNKSKWNKLLLTYIAREKGTITGSFIFSQLDVKDFSSLNGYVIFAYPELKVIKPKRTSQLVLPNQPKTFKIEKASLLPFIGLFSFGSERADSLSVDTLANTVPFQKEMANDHFSGPRLDRWRYAIYLYMHEYRWWQKIFGGGFNYTSKFAKTFESSRDYDYPHNPFLSVLLYSGIVGFFAYLWFLYKALYYYWFYRKEYWTFALAFGASFFYSFFSSNNPFEPAIMGILTIIPYFIHYYTINEKEMINE